MQELPMSLAIKYYKQMLKRIRLMEGMTEKLIEERIMPIMAQEQVDIAKLTNDIIVTNAAPDKKKRTIAEHIKYLQEQAELRISAELKAIEVEIQSLFTKQLVDDMARRFVKSTDIVAEKHILDTIMNIIGKPAQKSLSSINMFSTVHTVQQTESAIKDNVSLIKTIPQKYFKQIEQAVFKGLKEGQGTTSLAKDIVDIGRVSKRRGQFIARDQLGKVYGDITKTRQKDLGLKKFRWLTSQDERVRDSHAALDGNVYEWDAGAQGPEVAPEVLGLVPGEDYNCRCTSELVEDDLWELLNRIEANGHA